MAIYNIKSWTNISPLSEQSLHDGARIVDHALRLISKKERNVIKSKTFVEEYEALPNYLKSRMDTIIADIQSGNDLTKHLSRLVQETKYPMTRTVKPSETDWLLNDWRIHHLHLLPNGKGDTLLFAIFPNATDDAYLVALRDHKTFKKKVDHFIGLLEVIVDEWADRELVNFIPIPPFAIQNPTEQMVLESRRDGYTLFYAVKDRVVINWTSSNGSSYVGNQILARILNDMQGDLITKEGERRLSVRDFSRLPVPFDYTTSEELRPTPRMNPVQFEQMIEWGKQHQAEIREYQEANPHIRHGELPPVLRGDIPDKS